MSECGVAGRSAMVTTSSQLSTVLEGLAGQFPDVHDQLSCALGRVMRADGVMEFTVSALAKNAGVRLGLTKEYLRVARNQDVLHLLGRRTDDGKMRYCAYGDPSDRIEDGA